METDEPIGADEAAAALASVRHSRARVAWSGYPAWYWLVVMATRAACRARGVCEGWARSAITRRDRAVLYGPATAVIFTSGLTSRTAAWPSAVAAVLVFLLFAGTGLALSARAGFDHLIHAPARLRACAVLLPLGWALAACASLVLLVVIATRAACRARGVCEGWARSAMTRRDRAVLYGPATAVIFASGLTSRTAAWPSAVAAVLVFLLFAGTGLALSARAGCR